MADEHFRFLDLPFEVRGMIYKAVQCTVGNSIFVYEHERAIEDERAIERDGARQHDRIIDQEVDMSKVGLNLLRTCRTIYNEGRCYAKRERLIFTVDIVFERYLSTRRLQTLGQHFCGPLFVDVAALAVGAKYMLYAWGSWESLQARMPRLKVMQLVVVKRMPYQYWQENYPTVVSCLTSWRDGDTALSRACRSDMARGDFPELELARSRHLVRFNPMTSGDREKDNHQGIGYTEGKGAEVLEPEGNTSWTQTRELHILGRWILVDKNVDNQVRLVVETTLNLNTGLIFDARMGSLPAQSAQCSESLIDLERRYLRALHSTTEN